MCNVSNGVTLILMINKVARGHDDEAYWCMVALAQSCGNASQGLQERAAGALWGLSVSEANSIAIGREGGVAPLISLARSDAEVDKFGSRPKSLKAVPEIMWCQKSLQLLLMSYCPPVLISSS
eukprot:Gb_21668 [translate_table: standard]